jgi:5-methyltetrahydrofolate--homocysteine methyltransferase
LETKLASKSHAVTISPDQPFVMIGERINPTRRKALLESLVAGDYGIALQDARNQVAAGAQVLDVNAGVPGADEPKLIAELTHAILQEVDVPLCFDSANPAALEAALSIYNGKALINSTTGEEKMLNAVLPLAAKYHAAVIGVITDENGISPTPEGRLAVARKIVQRAADYAIPADDVVIDCLALTVGADSNAGRVTLETMSLVRKELGVNLSLGASNVSFGLPDRKTINSAYLALGIARGLTAAITDPTVPEPGTMSTPCAGSNPIAPLRRRAVHRCFWGKSTSDSIRIGRAPRRLQHGTKRCLALRARKVNSRFSYPAPEPVASK